MGVLSVYTSGFSSYATIITLLLFWLGGTVVYRLWLGPLTVFPGRRLAILTGWYETYFECIQRGRYWVEIEKMHEEYGRKAPQQLRCSKPLLL